MVYFMRGRKSGLIKIGLTQSLVNRVTQVGEEVEVMAGLALANKTDRELELELHARFQPIRAHGEWFLDDGSIAGLVDTLLLCGVAMDGDAAFEYSGLAFMQGYFRKEARLLGAIDKEFVKDVIASAVKRKQAMKAAKLAAGDSLDDIETE